MEKIMRNNNMNIDQIFKAVMDVDNWKTDLSKLTTVLESALIVQNINTSEPKSAIRSVSNFIDNLPKSNKNLQVSSKKNSQEESFTSKKRQRNSGSKGRKDLEGNFSSNDSKKNKLSCYLSDGEIQYHDNNLIQFENSINNIQSEKVKKFLLLRKKFILLFFYLNFFLNLSVEKYQ